jgi:hypothetical protein
MPNFLATPDQEAYFDFCSNIIVMKRYEAKHRLIFQQAISWVPGDPVDDRVSDFRALLKHEVTHFLDATTTLWGCQFNFRKLRMLGQTQRGGEEFCRAREVFGLESGELALHTELVRPGKIPPASCDTIQHELIYTDSFGVCLLIYYLKEGERIHKVPVSMLSLLEANATASEFLSLLQSAECWEDPIGRMLAKQEVERKFERLLNDNERLEYSVLLHLTKVHFKELSLGELLKLVAALVRFSLDLSDMAMAALAHPIEKSFENKLLGDALAMELRRSSHRQLVFFKTVLFMYGWIKQMDVAEQREYLALVRNAPAEAVRHLWTTCFGIAIVNDASSRESTIETMVHLIREEVLLQDGTIFSESCAHNRKFLETTSVGILNFKDIKLLDALLADDSEITFPNRIDISTLAYVDANLKTLTELDKVYRLMSHERFHIVPGTPKIRLM